MRVRYGLDQPLWVQYVRWVQGWPEGDFGWSMAWSAPVWPLVRDRLAYTVVLGAFSLLITVTYAIPVGIYSHTNIRWATTRFRFWVLWGFRCRAFCWRSFGCFWVRWCCAST
ncbi:MAG: hypothetical protein R2911_34660 [Caldilineaceae bacterium]